MSICTDIEKLVLSKEKEGITLELKSIKGLNDDKRGEFLKTLGYEFVALANTYGGRLLLGINDDGVYDGKFRGNVDDVKRDIINVCRDSISPSIDCKIEFIECEKGDFFKVHIPQRRIMPHAYVIKGGNEIKSRIYYVRTNHGKKLANDLELEWMFHNNGYPNLREEFNVIFEFSKDLVYCSKYVPRGGYYVNNFLSALSRKDKEKISEDNHNLKTFITELFPYLLIRSVAFFYGHGWDIHVTHGLNGSGSGALSTPNEEEKNTFKFKELKKIPTTIIKDLDWNIDTIFEGFAMFDFMHLPPNTTLNIDHSGGGAKIVIKNPVFEFEIDFMAYGYGAGLSQKNPDYFIALLEDPTNASRDAMTHFKHFDGALRITVTFEFPEDNLDHYNRLLNYCKLLFQIIKDNWSYDLLLEDQPSLEIRMMSNKIDRILDYLKP